MADNIKIVGEILNTQQVSRYDSDDTNLLSPILLKEDFGNPMGVLYTQYQEQLNESMWKFNIVDCPTRQLLPS